ncbi:MAG TPA: hypothetical protein VGM91_01035 [Conexibacter sp.]
MDKTGWDIGNPSTGNSTVQVSAGGEHVAYQSGGAFAGSPVSRLNNYYAAARGADGWTTTPLSPPSQPARGGQVQGGPNVYGVSSDFSSSLVMSDVELAPGAIPGEGNLYLRDISSGRYTLIVTTPDYLGLLFAGALPIGATPDYSRVVFQTPFPLTPDAADTVNQGILHAPNIYEWADGRIRLVNVLPDGSVDPGGASADTSFGGGERAVSADGRRIFFSSPSPFFGGATDNAELYMRSDGTTTTDISASQRGTPDPAVRRPVIFQAATADGSQVFFTSSNKLTDDATADAVNSGADLYRYDVSDRRLTDLTVTSNPGGARVSGVLGVSADGSYLYFVAFGSLTEDAPPETGESTVNNVYVLHDGHLSFVESETNVGDASLIGFQRNAFAISPSGRYFERLTALRLTNYDNDGRAELYLHDAEHPSSGMVCVSCNPSGKPSGDAAVVGTGDGNNPRISNAFPRTMFDDGTVVFQTADGLVPTDANGMADVYEYKDGQAQLISGGNQANESLLVGASDDAKDILFLTRDRLIPADQDALVDLYDAHVGGGFPEGGADVAPCSGDGCQAPPTPPPALPIAASIVFSGAGNAVPGATPSAPPKVKATARAVKGPKLSVQTRVGTAGTLRVSGASTIALKRAVGKAGTYKLTVSLTAKARRALAKHKRLRVRFRVAFTSRAGAASSAVVAVTVKQPPSRAHTPKRTHKAGHR